METVDVVFSGTVLSGFDPREAATTLAAMTGMSQDEALALLSSGKPQLARRGLSPEEAQTLTEQFAAMGVAAFVWTAEGKEGAAPEKLSLAKPASTVSPDKYLLDEDDEDFNPYTAPPADLSQTGPPKKKGGHWRETCVVVPAARGIQWIKESWAMFKSAPVTWLGALLLSWFCMSVLGMLVLPQGFLGILAFLLCVPFFAGGLALLAHRQTEHEVFGAFDVFAAFYVCPNNMLFLGILGFACSILAGPFFRVAFSLVTGLGGGAMGRLAIFLPLIAALYMASTLVAVGGLYPPQSIWQGFLATCKNWRPILLNALILGGIPGSLALLIGLIHPLVTGKGAQEAATFLAAIQAFLIAILAVVSLLILLVMPAIIYRAVRDMFYEEGKEGS